jgi:putative tryptophan/tyrosine transport system substrate-binding protein
MRRREFIILLGGAVAAWPNAVHGQQRKKIPRVGFLGLTSPAGHARLLEAFRRGLRDLGYIDGESIWVEYRWAEGQYDRLPQLATDLIREKVDLVVTYGSEGALAAKRSITTVPVVAVSVGDFVGAGVVKNLSRPEANVTGLSLLATEVSEKRLGLLQDTLPQLRKIAVLWNPGNASVVLKFKSVEAGARTLGIQVLDLKYTSVAEFTQAISTAAQARADALFTADDFLLVAHATQIAVLAREFRLPLVSEFREVAEAGGLWSYGPNLPDIYRRAATFVDKLLKGATPGDLPVEQPTKFEFVINRQTARLIGLELSPALIARADEVIE